MTTLFQMLMMVGLWSGCGGDNPSGDDNTEQGNRSTGPEGQTLEIRSDYWDNGSIMFEFQYYKDGSLQIKHGSYKAWDESGNLLTDGTFDQGKRNGIWFDRAIGCEVYEELSPGLAPSEYDYYWNWCIEGEFIEYSYGLCLNDCAPIPGDGYSLDVSPISRERSNPYDPAGNLIDDRLLGV